MGPTAGSSLAPSLKKICATALISVQKKTSPIDCFRVSFLCSGLARDEVASLKDSTYDNPIRGAGFGTIKAVNKEKTTATADTEDSAKPAKSDIPRGVIAEWTVTILLLL